MPTNVIDFNISGIFLFFLLTTKLVLDIQCHDLLIYTTPTRIKALNLTTHRVDIIQHFVECTTLTAAHDYIFYTKYQEDSRTIYQTSISTNKTTEVLNWNLPVTSISIDYITENLYFSTETSIMVCSPPYKYSCTRIICCNANFVTLVPKSGIMFYTRKARGNKKYIIFKSNMDGSDEEIVIDGVFDNLVSLTVDESEKRLYWLEKQEKKIHYVPFGTTQIKSIPHEGDSSTSSITIFQKKVLFVKNQNNMVISMKNFQDFILFYPDMATLSIELLYAYNPSLQQMDKVLNPCSKTSCLSEPNTESICLLRSSSSSNSLNFSCKSFKI